MIFYLSIFLHFFGVNGKEKDKKFTKDISGRTIKVKEIVEDF